MGRGRSRSAVDEEVDDDVGLGGLGVSCARRLDRKKAVAIDKIKDIFFIRSPSEDKMSKWTKYADYSRLFFGKVKKIGVNFELFKSP